ncbi:head protein [Secundilactobacillus pentosiphilus]|uniref:Head protein n=1 Tax=Secundilactobacillus pentosiphilus TaxID=1714682 RepID=A0A1Z5IYE7_9LACO|nr:N4-gp56 family major capsid protein [Secundilactobacillus pentosiphilus]GAX06815.1 head protein [Secundilactobacillus pentosiphilus]
MADPDLSTTTTKDTQVIPQVMAAMIAAQLPKAIRFTPIATVDSTLVGQPGDTITVPRYQYIGDAQDVAEGGAIQYKQLTTGTTTATIKKAGIGVQLTDEAMLSAYGDPKTEAARQIAISIASKVDNDVLATALTAPLTVTADPTSLDVIDAIETAFNDDDNPLNFEDSSPITGTIFMNPDDVSKLRKAAADDWTRASDLGDSILISGTFGELLGWQIVRSRKIKTGQALAVKPGAIKLLMKRAVTAETARDIDHKLTKLNADEHYGVSINDDSKVLVINAASKQ